MGKRNWILTLVVSLMICVTPCANCDDKAPAGEFERLLDAIAKIESNNRSNAVGDKGRAIGAYQIHRAYWKDGTRILKVKWDYKEAFHPGKARRVVKAYLRHYGRGKSLVQMARIHNGGPRGYRKKATLGYARKIRNILRRKSEN